MHFIVLALGGYALLTTKVGLALLRAHQFALATLGQTEALGGGFVCL